MNLNNIGMNEFFNSQLKENESVGRVAKYAQIITHWQQKVD